MGDEAFEVARRSVQDGVVDDEQGRPWRVLYLGPDHAANLLDVVVEREDGSEPAIHAMMMRSRYESLLPPGVDTTMSESQHDTSGGVKLNAEQLGALVEEAERGCDTDRLRTRSRRGRPPLDTGAATIFPSACPLRRDTRSSKPRMQSRPRRARSPRQPLTDYLGKPSA